PGHRDLADPGRGLVEIAGEAQDGREPFRIAFGGYVDELDGDRLCAGDLARLSVVDDLNELAEKNVDISFDVLRVLRPSLRVARLPGLELPLARRTAAAGAIVIVKHWRPPRPCARPWRSRGRSRRGRPARRSCDATVGLRRRRRGDRFPRHGRCGQ